MLVSEAMVSPNTQFKLPKGIDAENFVIYWVHDVEKAIRFVKIPNKNVKKTKE